MAPNLVFFGSSPFSVPVLQKLLDSNLISIVTTPDKPVGRHLKLTPNPVKLLAQKNNIPVIEDLSVLLKTSPLTPLLNSGEGNQRGEVVALVAAYGRIIPPEVLSIFNNHIYNIHPSLLPKYRGASPLQQQILDAVSETGVTVIQLDAKMDHGPIVAQEKGVILETDTPETLGTRLFSQGTDLFLSRIKDLGSSIPTPQDESQATYTKKLTRDSGFIPWPEFTSALKIKNSKLEIERKWRAFHPWPGIWSINSESKRVKLISINPLLYRSYDG